MKDIKVVGLKALHISLIIICFSCGRESKIGLEIENRTAYYLEKVDSIHIDRENQVRVLDFHDGNNRFLAYDQITQEFLILNDRGNILESVHRAGEGPNEYSSNILAASFNNEDGGYLMLSSHELLRYNELWEVYKRIRFSSYIQIKFYNGPKFKVPYYNLSNNSNLYFYTSFFPGVDTNIGGKGNEQALSHLIELYNPDKELIEWKLPQDNNLIPDFELDEERREIKPTQLFSLDNNRKRLFLTFARSSEIGIYDLENDYALISKIQFDHESFLQSNQSKNIALFNFGSDTFAVVYYMGLSEAAKETRKANKTDYNAFFDPSLYRIIVSKDGLQHELAFPLHCEPHSEMIQLPNNRLMLRKKHMGDDEAESSDYLVYELKSH